MKLPDNIPSEIACTLPCGAITAYNSLTKIQDSIARGVKVKGKARLLILGLGGLGIWCLQLVRHVLFRYPIHIVVGDINADKVTHSRDSGANDGISWQKEDTEDDVISLAVQGGKFDACIDFVGNPFTNKVAFGSLRSGGTLAAVGLAAGVMEAPIVGIVAKTIRIQGMRVAPLHMLREVVNLLTEVDIEPPPVEVFKLEDINDALDKMRAGKLSGRAVIKHVVD